MTAGYARVTCTPASTAQVSTMEDLFAALGAHFS